MEESGSVFPRDGGGGEKNHREEWEGGVKGKRENGGDTRERIIPMHHTEGESKEEKKEHRLYSFYAAIRA